jgi:uncharacterized protein (DUF1778 family)
VKDRTETALKELALRRDTHSRGRECKEELSAEPAESISRKKYPKEVRVRLTDDEYEEITERAKTAGMSLSRCIVEHALADSETFLKNEAPDDDCLMEREFAIFLVACAGVKLNDIARRLNAQRGTINLNEVEEVLLETKSALEGLAILYRRR